MCKKLMSSIALTILFLASISLADEGQENKKGQKNVLTSSSDSVGALVLDKKIKLMMRDGTYVEGKVLQASQESITLKVKKSDPKDRFREKEAIIPTQDIGSIYFSKGGNIAVPIVFGVGGALAGAAAAAAGGEENYAGAFIGPPLGAIFGVFVGRELVKKTVTINIPQSQGP
jgi:hypothetical protein